MGKEKGPTELVLCIRMGHTPIFFYVKNLYDFHEKDIKLVPNPFYFKHTERVGVVLETILMHITKP